MTQAPDQRLHAAFRERVRRGAFLPASHGLSAAGLGLTSRDLLALFEAQLMSRHTDLIARALGRQGRGFYSIGSSGHEGNAAAGFVLRPTDMAFLHYRSGAFLLARQGQVPGRTPLWDMALSLVASADDPVSGGRHKVLGDTALNVPPQTSTIASHLPKAMGAAYSLFLSRRLKKEDAAMPRDGIVYCSFGDASANHSTAAGALNAAANISYRGIPLPIIFQCEDNGIGISVDSAPGFLEATYSRRPGLTYLSGDGTELLDAIRVSQEAEDLARRGRKPIFLHLKTVRLMGHAGSDVEGTYRPAAEIETAEKHDPLVKSARTLIEEGALSTEEILALDTQISQRMERIAEAACQRPRLTSAAEVTASIMPQKAKPAPLTAPGLDAPEMPLPMGRLISLALADLMERDKNIVLFGEDVGRKGGVYGATHKLQERIGALRVFDTLLDEQTVLGLAIGMAQNGFLPMPEIQFLAYLHNAEDQLRGEAATLPFFSGGKLANPMVVRIAGLGYQRGFGGHFHNDNSLGVLRDIPGLIVACPSNGHDAVLILREAHRLAREERRVVVVIEPIALYGQKDLYKEGDGLMATHYPIGDTRHAFGEVGTFGEGTDVAILSYGNGAYLSRKALKTLHRQHGIAGRLIDLRWLNPLPFDGVEAALGDTRHVLIVDECRRTGNVSEELMTYLAENVPDKSVARVTAADSFIPLGPAAYTVLPSKEDIVSAALSLRD